MPKSKSMKKKVKRNKKYPPLSKEDKFLYTLFEISGAFLLLVLVYLYDLFIHLCAFRNADVLAVESRWTVALIVPVTIFSLFLIFKIGSAKKPITGNKKVDYYSSDYKFILPLCDKRYKNNEKYKAGRKKFIKIFVVYFCIFIVLLSVGISGCIGRHEFNENGIITYGILNNKLADYSYDDVESYSVSASVNNIVRTRGLSHRTYDIDVVLEMPDGKTFTASYDIARNIYALEKIDNLLEGKNKTVNSAYLQKFEDTHELTDDELITLYKLFEE